MASHRLPLLPLCLKRRNEEWWSPPVANMDCCSLNLLDSGRAGCRMPYLPAAMAARGIRSFFAEVSQRSQASASFLFFRIRLGRAGFYLMQSRFGCALYIIACRSSTAWCAPAVQ